MGMTIYLHYICFGLLLAILVTQTSGQCICSEKKHGIKSFHACDCKKTWADAQSFCAILETGGHLAVIPDKATQDVVSIFLRDNNLGDTWIGGKSVKRDWHWVPGNETLSGQGCWTDTTFARDLPVSRNIQSLTPDACISRCKSDGYKYAGVQGGIGCYCGNSYGSYGLASPCTAWCAGASSRFCGGTDINYVYNVNGVYSQWGATGHPDSVSLMQPQSCMVLSCETQSSGDESWEWMPKKCSSNHKFLCDYPLGETTCKSKGYKWAGGKCFSFSEDDYKTWFDARRSCLSNNGDLLVVKDEATHNAISKQIQCIQSKFWIAGSRSTWTWTTGETFSYTSWATSSPSDDGTERCITMSDKLSQDYQWGDSNCKTELLTFLCESRKGTTASTTTSTTTKPTTTKPTTTPTTPSTTTTPPILPPSSTTSPKIVPTPSPSDKPTTRPLTTKGQKTTATTSFSSTGKPPSSTKIPVPSIGSSKTTRATKASTKPTLAPGGSTKSPKPTDGSTKSPLPPDGSTKASLSPKSSFGPSPTDISTLENTTAVPGGKPGGSTQRGPLEGSLMWIGVGLGIFIFVVIIIIVGVVCKRRNKPETRKSPAMTVSDSSNQFILKGPGGVVNGFRKDSEFSYIDVRHDAPLKTSSDKLDNPERETSVSAPNNMSHVSMNNTPVDLTSKYTNLLMGDTPPKQQPVTKNTNEAFGKAPSAYHIGESPTPPESISPQDYDSFVYENERGTSEAPSLFMDDTGSVDSGHPGFIGSLEDAVYVDPRSDDDDDVIIIPTNEITHSDPNGASTTNNGDSGILLADGTVDQAGLDDDCYTRL